MDTFELFQKLKNNDLSAFNKIYSLYSRKVLNFAYSFSISLEHAEEVVQDPFVKLWDKRDFLDLGKSAEALLFVIAKNLVLNKIKKYSLDRNHLSKYCKNKVSSYDSLEKQLNFKEMELILTSIIEDLPKKRREIFTLNRMKGLTYVEIARSMNISTGTVEKQMKKVLETVNEKFRAYYKLVVIILSSIFIH